MGDRDKIVELIEAWFADHEGGEFVAYDPTIPFNVIGTANEVSRFVFATKSTVVFQAIDGCAECAGLGIIARYGLPGKKDAQWIADLTARHDLLFLGDMDPVDLLVFAWLRARLHRKRVEHLGVSDRYLALLQVELPEHYTIELSPSERASMALVEKVLPDFREIVGMKCAAVLQQGRKIEQEAVVSTLGAAGRILLPAMMA